MSFFSFLKTDKEEISIVFDVGSGTLGGALVRFRPHLAPEILFTYREPIISRKNIDSESLTNAMLKTLENVSSAIIHDGLVHQTSIKHGSRKIHNIYYVFSSPWVLSQTKIIDIKKDHEILITKDLIDSTVKEEEKTFRKTYADGKDTEDPEDLKIIEKSVVGISLNGYRTEDPYQKKAHNVRIPFFISVTSEKLIEKMNAVVYKSVHFKTSLAYSCMLLSYLTLRDIYHEESDFMLVDIHGELTDLAIVKDGVLIQTASYPLGVNTILRDVSDKLKTAPQISESYIKIFLDGKADNKLSVTMKEVLGNTKRQWSEHFHKSVENLHKEISLPQTIFLIVSNGMEKFFADFLREEKFDSLTITNGSFKVIPLEMDNFSNFQTSSKDIARDSFLSIHSIALNKLIDHNKKLI